MLSTGPCITLSPSGITEWVIIYPDQSNPLTTDLEWAEVEKKHPFESGFKELHLENI